MKTIRYYLAPRSPWTYLGHERLREVARRHNATIEPRPFGLGDQIFPASGGLPLEKRPPQRQAYRLIELQRWSEFLEVPLNLHPKYFPVEELEASKFIIAATQKYGANKALDLAGAIMRAVWAQDRNIADTNTLSAIADENGLSGSALLADSAAATPIYESYTQDAIALQAFGAPWYEYRGESFWGQDRLDFLDRALAAA